MINTYSFLHDKRFLEQLDSLRIKQQFVRITVLNWKEQPLEQIQGIAISGSVNLDGSSSMRRTATLSLFAEEKENNLANVDHLFSINKKCILELGIINEVPNYTYIEKNENDEIRHIEINYKQLYGNIIWFPLGVYVMFNPSIAHSMQGVTISMQLKDKMCLLNGDLGGEIHSSVDFSYQDQVVNINSESVDKKQVLIYNIIKELVNHWGNQKLSNIIISEVPLRIKRVVKWIGNERVWLTKENDKHGCNLTTSKPDSPHNDYPNGFESGMDVGFLYDDFIYPGELTCNAGDTVTSVLDKIIGIMGNYEYFYDVFGQFRFQEKQNYLNMTNTAVWSMKTDQYSKVINLPSDVYQADYYRLTKSVYDFTDNNYTTTYNNSLNYNNVKNDFVVWGSRKSVDSNIVLPCRFHLAIDKKPDLNQHRVVLYKDEFQIWRARGAAAYEENVQTRTSVDWRQEIYYQMLEDEKNGTGQDTELNNTYFQYYAELKEEFPKIFDLKTQDYKEDFKNHPQKIEYFLDFIDENSQLGGFSVSNIGRRAKIIDDNNEGINCVFEPQIPDIVYIDTTKYTSEQLNEIQNQFRNMNQRWTQINPKLSTLLITGGVFNSCFEKIKDLLYQYTHVNNTISITTLPIYYLEPNTRITVEDTPAGIYGDYIIQSISIPLDISSTMNINAYKALQKI